MLSRLDLIIYDTFYLLDHFLSRKVVNFILGGIRQRQRSKFLEKVRDYRGKVIPVERRKDLSPDEFYRHYFKRGIPVVLESAAKDWQCVKQWDFEYLSKQVGSDPVMLLPKERTTDGFEGTRNDESVEHTDFKSFIDGLKQGTGKYLRFSTIVEDHKQLSDQMDMKVLKRYFGPLVFGHRIHSFIGSQFSRTRLHCDFPPNLFTQIKGRKHWVLFPPESRVVIDPLLERSSLSFTTNLEVRAPREATDSISKHIDRYETTLEPGDILFNPAYMWHDVYNLDDSIGVSVRWLSLGVHWRAAWVPQLLNTFATNPPIWRAGLSKRDINKNLLDSKNNAKKDSTYIG